MRLRVSPIYGWGWFRADGGPIDVPLPFEIEAQSTAPPFVAVGKLDDIDHPLSGMWLRLSQRLVEWNGECNLQAFNDRPNIIDTGTAGLTGFADVTVICNS